MGCPAGPQLVERRRHRVRCAWLLAVGAFLLAQRTLEIGFQDPGVQINLWLHLFGALATIVLVRLSTVRIWNMGS